MSKELPEEVRRIAELVLAHLRVHPAAADTVNGVWRYWLPSGLDTSRKNVEEALAELMRRGLVAQRQLPDGGLIYLLGPAGVGGLDG